MKKSIIKKAFIILLAVTLVFSFVSCGKSAAQKAADIAAAEARMSRAVLNAMDDLNISLIKLENIPLTSSQSLIDTCTSLMEDMTKTMKKYSDGTLSAEKYIEEIKKFNDKVDRLLK